MAQTVMAEAFAVAENGPHKKLEALMREAINHVRGRVGDEPIQEFLRLLSNQEPNSMERELCREWRDHAALKLWKIVKEKMWREGIRFRPERDTEGSTIRDAGEGQASHAREGHRTSAPSHPEPYQHAGRGHVENAMNGRVVDASPRAEPNPGASSGDGHGHGDDTQRGGAVANFHPARQPLGAQVILGPLQREIIVAGGIRKPLAIATAAEARLYSKLIGFRSAWIERLVTGLTDDAVIGEHRADADVERAMVESRKALAHV